MTARYALLVAFVAVVVVMAATALSASLDQTFNAAAARFERKQ